MHEVWWKCTPLLHLVHWEIVVAVVDVEAVVDRVDVILAGVCVPVWLGDRQAQRSDPADQVASASHDACAIDKPAFNGVSPAEEILDTLHGALGNVDAGEVLLFLVLQEGLVLDLSVDLLSCPDEGNTVDTRHHSLLNCFTFDVASKFLG